MEVDIPEPNPALAEVLLGETMRRIMEERAGMAALLTQAQVAKRTGTLARSAHSSVEVGGVRNDRWVGVMVLGDASRTGSQGGAFYAASHEFGTHVQSGSHDLNVVLEQLESM